MADDIPAHRRTVEPPVAATSIEIGGRRKNPKTLDDPATEPEPVDTTKQPPAEPASPARGRRE